MLTREQFAKLEQLFDEVLAAPAQEREALIEQHCGQSPELGEPLRDLLRAHEQQSPNSTNQLVQEVSGQLRTHLPDLVHAGAIVGEYRLLEQIGVGGMGRVYRASRSKDGVHREFALKLLRQELSNTVLLQRFAQEKDILQRMEHPGICRLVDAGSLANGTPFVVMELIQGKNLLEYCQDNALSLNQRLVLFRKVLAAVAYAHQHLIVHRDLKAANILVDQYGEPKLLDFGIAKALDQAGVQTQTATVDRFISFAHAAPEQLRGQIISTGCDIYALGALLYQLLCGASPFDYERLSAGELERHILDIPPEAMTKRVTEIDVPVAAASPWRVRGFSERRGLQRELRGDLESIVQQCLRKNPDERYRSVEQLDEDVERFLEQRPIRTKSSNALYRMRKFIARNRLACGLTGILLVSIVLGVTAVANRTREATAQAQRAQQALDILRSAFLSADPARVAGQEVSARAVLDAAIPQLEERFVDAPELYANLASTIAEVNLALGLFPQSSKLFGRAVQAAAIAELTPQVQFELRIWAARASYSAGEFDAANEHLKHAEQMGVPLTPEWQITRALMLVRERDFKQATQLLEQAVYATADRPRIDEWANFGRTRLADAYMQQRDHERALEVLHQTLTWHAHELDATHPRVVLTKIHLATQKNMMGRGEEALGEAQEILKLVKQKYGPRSPFAARAAMVIGNIYAGSDKDMEAVGYYREAMEIFHEQLGDRYPNAIRNVFNLAQVLDAQPGKRAEATPYYQQSVSNAELSFGIAGTTPMIFRNRYAKNLLERGLADDALRLLRSENAMAGLANASAELRAEYLDLLRRTHEKACLATTSSTDNTLCDDPSILFNETERNK